MSVKKQENISVVSTNLNHECNLLINFLFLN